MSPYRPLVPTPHDPVRGDIDALASHMRHCARADGRWPHALSLLQRAHALAMGRIVTTACVPLALGVLMYLLLS